MRILESFWIYIILMNTSTTLCIQSNTKGTDIGYSCNNDVECTAGNGGEYSKCNKDLNICICTINHLGEDKCLDDSDKFYNVCRRKTFYTIPKMCTLECLPKGTRKLRKGHDWYGEILQPFSSFVLDNTTSVCYDPKRALNTIPSGFEVKPSSLPGIGLGAFTTTYIERDAIIGPYKGVFDHGESEEDMNYGWQINGREGEMRAELTYVDAFDITLSNWLRYINTPINASLENMAAVQYKGEVYYRVIRAVPPGTELFVWYGDGYAKYLRLKLFKHPSVFHATDGYNGGSCTYDEERQPCMHDKNTICADNLCLCKHGSNVRAGICYLDGALGGQCLGVDGETCELDKNAECQRGLCVCKNGTIPGNGACRQAETLGGRCSGSNGQPCLVDTKAECVRGICRCIYGTTAIGGICVTDETSGGRCEEDDGEDCELDNNAECWNNVCECVEFHSEVNGLCQRDGYLGGICVDDNCLGKNVECDTVTQTCTCEPDYRLKNEKCVKYKTHI